jgi:pyrimidine-nucleoside phosphorylase
MSSQTEFLPAEIIKKKRNGGALSDSEIRFMIENFSHGSLPDYQMSALLMAIYFKGMDIEETAVLTEAMMNSGRTLDFSHLPGIAVDKHSTGGVGDKTSMILAPIVAACGVPVPMIAGRGLGHTGGTLDKLESIPGFRIGLSLADFQRQVEKLGFAIIGQTGEICPADKKIYALRDVTATIESFPLICASIMSKKLAEGIGALVLDVKFGNGAFMKTLADADALAEKLMQIGASHGKRVAALLTNMDQPLGVFIGNSLEMGECFSLMKNEPYLSRGPSEFADTLELTLELAAHMIWLGGRAGSPDEGLRLAQDALDSGRAWEAFERLCVAQGGDPSKLPVADIKIEIKAESDGCVSAFDTEKIGIASLRLGAGRIKTSDIVDPTAGIEMHHKIGSEVKRGDRLYTLYVSRSLDTATIDQVKVMLLSATSISLQKPAVPVLIAQRKVTNSEDDSK